MLSGTADHETASVIPVGQLLIVSQAITCEYSLLGSLAANAAVLRSLWVSEALLLGMLEPDDADAALSPVKHAALLDGNGGPTGVDATVSGEGRERQ